VGLGYFYQKEPNIALPYDPSKLGLPDAGAVNAFPFATAFPTSAFSDIGGVSNLISGVSVRGSALAKATTPINSAGTRRENGQALNVTNPTGFAYASFLMGQPDSLSLAQPTFTRLGGHASLSSRRTTGR